MIKGSTTWSNASANRLGGNFGLDRLRLRPRGSRRPRRADRNARRQARATHPPRRLLVLGEIPPLGAEPRLPGELGHEDPVSLRAIIEHVFQYQQRIALPPARSRYPLAPGAGIQRDGCPSVCPRAARPAPACWALLTVSCQVVGPVRPVSGYRLGVPGRRWHWQPGAQVGELGHAVIRRPRGSPGDERPVLGRRVAQLRVDLQEPLSPFPVGSEVVVSAGQVLVHPGRVRPGEVNP